MMQDEFDAYMRRNIAPVQSGAAFDERTRRTLAQLPPVKEKNRKPLMIAAFAAQAVVLALLMLVLLPYGETSLSTQWLTAYSSEDGEQYIIEGKVFEPHMVSDADADDDDYLQTTSYEVFTEYFGCDPNIPQELIPGWKAESYSGIIREHGESGFSVEYRQAESTYENLWYSMDWVLDTQEKFRYRQEGVKAGYGTAREIEGTTVFVYDDSDMNPDNDEDIAKGFYQFLWITETTECSISGYADPVQMEQAVVEMMHRFNALPEEIKQKWVPDYIENEGHSQIFETTSYDEARAFLGEDILIPTLEVKGHRFDRYYCIRKSIIGREAWALYENNDKPNEYSTVEVIEMDNYEDMYMCYEQNEPGKVIRHGNLDIYIAYNYEHILGICMKDRTLYTVTGMIDEETVKDILAELIPQ